MVHIANLPSFKRRTIYYGPDDWKNLNRVFPGDPAGTMSQRIAAVLNGEIVGRADVLVDMHCGDGNEALIPLHVLDDQRRQGLRREDPGPGPGLRPAPHHHRRHPRPRPQGVQVSRQHRHPPRQAGHHHRGRIPRAHRRGVHRPERPGRPERPAPPAKMIDGAPEPAADPVWIDKYEVVFSKWSGLFAPRVPMGGYVKAGQIVGTVTDYHGTWKEDVQAPFTGILLYVIGTPPCNEGEPLFEVGRVRGEVTAGHEDPGRHLRPRRHRRRERLRLAQDPRGARDGSDVHPGLPRLARGAGADGEMVHPRGARGRADGGLGPARRRPRSPGAPPRSRHRRRARDEQLAPEHGIPARPSSGWPSTRVITAGERSVEAVRGALPRGARGRSGLEPDECGVVGDTRFDVLAALDAGIGAIFLLSDEPEQFAGFPVEVFPGMDDLLRAGSSTPFSELPAPARPPGQWNKSAGPPIVLEDVRSDRQALQGGHHEQPRPPFQRSVVLLAALAALAAAAQALRADGFIIPDRRPGGEIVPPLSVKYHRVKVEIVDQVARTSVDQVFVNPTRPGHRGDLHLPRPRGRFGLRFRHVHRRPSGSRARCSDSREARRIYEDIVRRMTDPGLLEYMGRNLFRARVYPIPARRREAGPDLLHRGPQGRGRPGPLPLSARTRSGSPATRCDDVSDRRPHREPRPRSSTSIRRRTGSPSGRRARDGAWSATRTGTSGRTRISTSTTRSPGRGRAVASSNWEGPDGGFFMLLASPRFAAPGRRSSPRTSSSSSTARAAWSGAKMRQARAAARFILSHLDRARRLHPDRLRRRRHGLLRRSLLPATAENVGRALKFVDGIEDAGGTNINDALLGALARMRSGERPGYVLFLTDGLPTVGTTETADILRNLAEGERPRALAHLRLRRRRTTSTPSSSTGSPRTIAARPSTSVPTEDLEVALSSFYEKISSPLLSDVAVEFSGIETSQVYPRVLPDLFKGSQLVLVGRYKGDGPVSVALTGRTGPGREALRPRAAGPGRKRQGELPAAPLGDPPDRLSPRGGPAAGPNAELEDEIRRLGLKYGIVTPFTSFLVTEKERMTIDAAAPAAQEAIASGR
ncbi:MAG: succinylglutamate desuccinylase/aspartoacylase family protein [Desulfobacterales bacterium]|nr:succinylglutamate desuccinylase/aspartoacylase family protein [Desulfobacterales bacterium]